MSDTLVHRGPDDSGCWVDPVAGVGLGHRRLSILDLSPAGHQPMVSVSGRYVIVYNGEVYNFRELRPELEARGAVFRSSSDTEVMLAAFEAWGIAAATRRFRGIFAYALWDREQRELILARDHLGVKPLCYGFVGGALVFASDLRAVERAPGFEAALDRGAVALLLRFNCIPAPHTIYANMRKLLPGTLARWRPERGGEPIVEPYWSARDAAIAGVTQPVKWGDAEAVTELEGTLERVIRRQMLSDVPLGAFLSGGIDSTTVVALMQRLSNRPVRTFSIGSDDPSYDEAGHARAVARHLGTEHTELIVTAQDALAIVPRLAEIYDEPFADSSQIPTYIVSALARREVTVALSGDGGDELFAGYNRHVIADRLWQRLRPVPRWVRAGAARAVQAVSPSAWEALVRRAAVVRSRQVGVSRIGYNLHKLAGVLDVHRGEEIYERLVSHWPRPGEVVRDAREPKVPVLDPSAWSPLPSLAEKMMAADLVSYLPDDILTKVDRASMAVSLEARVPLLDPDVVELAWRLPLRLKLRDGQGKWILRQVLHRHVPPPLVDRPKSGFAVPVGDWLRGPLREWAEALLDPARLVRENVFDARPVRAMWAAHLNGRVDAQHQLWDVLMFQAWAEAHGR